MSRMNESNDKSSNKSSSNESIDKLLRRKLKLIDKIKDIYRREQESGTRYEDERKEVIREIKYISDQIRMKTTTIT
jgi:hypothetical protein